MRLPTFSAYLCSSWSCQISQWGSCLELTKPDKHILNYEDCVTSGLLLVYLCYDELFATLNEFVDLIVRHVLQLLKLFCVLMCSCWCLFGVRVMFYCLCETFMPNHCTIPWSLNPNIYVYLHHLIKDKNVALRSIFVHTLPALSTKIFADHYHFISDRLRYVIKREICDTLKKKKLLFKKKTYFSKTLLRACEWNARVSQTFDRIYLSSGRLFQQRDLHHPP